MWRSLAATGVVVMTVTASGNQGPQLNSIMREKLSHSQKILEAVVTSDWGSLESHSRELERLTNDPRWAGLKYPEYARYSAAFVRARKSDYGRSLSFVTIAASRREFIRQARFGRF